MNIQGLRARLRRSDPRLGRQEKAGAMLAHPGADTQFRVTIGCGSIEVVDSILKQKIEIVSALSCFIVLKAAAPKITRVL